MKKYNQILLIILCFFSILFTYYIAAFYDDPDTRSHLLIYSIYFNIILAIFLFFIILKRILRFWFKKKQHDTKLHKQNIILFSVVAIVPSVFAFIFNFLFLNMGIESWFGRPVKSSIHASNNIANAYLEENVANIKLQAQNIRQIFRMELQNILDDPDGIEKYTPEIESIVNRYAFNSNLSEFLVFNNHQEIVAKSYLSLSIEFEKIKFSDYEKVILSDEIEILKFKDRIRALFRLDTKGQYFVFIGKIFPDSIVKNLSITQRALDSFKKLQIQKTDLQIGVTLIMAVVAVLLLLIAIWFGLHISDRFMKPIDDLVNVTDHIRKGDWSVRVPVPEQKNELKNLLKTFNIMLDQIYRQHHDLQHEKQMNETIIETVSTAIICFDSDGKIYLSNPRANVFFKDKKIVGKSLSDISPELSFLFKKFLKNPKEKFGDKLIMNTVQGMRTCQICIGALRDHFIITFEDVTDLLITQKRASWSDMARKIAHEIKNPLTPIQLSAERLKKRFSNQIQENQTVFKDCIDVIIRQVQSIFALVKQFTAFASNIPPVFSRVDLVDMSKKLVTFYEESHPAIEFIFRRSESEILCNCDSQQIQQVLINLVNNAIFILQEKKVKNPKVLVTVLGEDRSVSILVEDNGPGFPKEILKNITSPEISMRKGGTGLGLAIVDKIIHDHNGEILFTQSKDLKGAKVEVILKHRIDNHDIKT